MSYSRDAGYLVALITISIGTGMCLLVLLAFAYVAFHSRHCLDRISFRLLAAAIAVSTLYGAFVLATLLAPKTSPACAFSAWLSAMLFNLQTLLFLCMGINLYLVLVHAVNVEPVEKYYFSCSLALSLVLTIPAYASEKFGYIDKASICWFAEDAKGLFQWAVGTQVVWNFIFATTELWCFINIIWFMLMYQKKTKLMEAAAVASDNVAQTSNSSHLRLSPLAHAHQYRNIVLRIALYPMISCLFNFPTAAMDLTLASMAQSSSVSASSFSRGFLLADMCLYGLRLISYALAAITDPAFLRALRATRASAHANSGGVEHDSFVILPPPEIQTQMTLHIELQPRKYKEDVCMFNEDGTEEIQGSNDIISPVSVAVPVQIVRTSGGPSNELETRIQRRSAQLEAEMFSKHI